MTNEGVTTNLKTPITYYGGKQQMLPKILPNIPDHKVYCEPFCGGAALFWAKEPARLEILNDTNRELINFYKVLQMDFVALEKEIHITLHSRDLHRKAWTVYNNPDMFSDVKRAWAVWVLSVQGFSGQLSSSWGRDKVNNRTSKMVMNKRNNFSEQYAIRMQDVQLEARDAIRVIKANDQEGIFFYIDPPYYNSDMGHYDGYTIEDYELLLITLSNIEGKFMLSSYRSDILKKFTKSNKWYKKEFNMNVSVSKGGKRKIEVITSNYELK